jgi:hypothetical protein
LIVEDPPGPNSDQFPEIFDAPVEQTRLAIEKPLFFPSNLLNVDRYLNNSGSISARSGAIEPSGAG